MTIAAASSTHRQTLSAAVALSKREFVRFFRQRTRVIGAIGQPLIFWILFGAGLHGSFEAPPWADALGRDISYQEYFFPGIAVLIILFTAIFSTISVIEDRREGFLQGVLVAPVSRTAIVLGKLLGGTGIAMIQASLFLLLGPVLHSVGLAPAIPIEWSMLRLVSVLGFLALISMELTAIGFVIAWPMSSSQGYHAVMSVFLMPMWLLSGAFFPGGGVSWLTWIIRLNPLTYGVAGLRRLLYSVPLDVSPGLPSMPACLAVTVVGFLVVFFLAIRLVSRPSIHNVA
jgi:ABC-2 type transport system permease protein